MAVCRANPSMRLDPWSRSLSRPGANPAAQGDIILRLVGQSTAILHVGGHGGLGRGLLGDEINPLVLAFGAALGVALALAVTAMVAILGPI